MLFPYHSTKSGFPITHQIVGDIGDAVCRIFNHIAYGISGIIQHRAVSITGVCLIAVVYRVVRPVGGIRSIFVIHGAVACVICICIGSRAACFILSAASGQAAGIATVFVIVGAGCGHTHVGKHQAQYKKLFSFFPIVLHFSV